MMEGKARQGLKMVNVDDGEVRCGAAQMGWRRGAYPCYSVGENRLFENMIVCENLEESLF